MIYPWRISFFVIYYLFTSSLVTCKRISICKLCCYFQHDNIIVVGNVLDKEFEAICEWFVDSKLPIHFGEDKTKCISFTKNESVCTFKIS